MKLFGLVGVVALAVSAAAPSPGLSERVPVATDSDVPMLHIRSKAALAKNDAPVTANVYGRPFEVFERLGPSPNPSSYESVYRRKLTGPITAKDLRSVELKLVVDYEKMARVYTLAYRVELERGFDHLEFLVDADTGVILRAPQPPGPLVP